MRHGTRLRFWPLVLVALLAGCDSEKTPGATGGSGGAAGQDGGSADTGASGNGGGGGGGAADGGNVDTVTPPPGDGGLAPCLDRPGDLERPPSGRLPCDLLPPGFVVR